MLPFYILLLVVLSACAGLILLSQANQSVVPASGPFVSAFVKLRNNYVFVYALMMGTCATEYRAVDALINVESSAGIVACCFRCPAFDPQRVGGVGRDKREDMEQITHFLSIQQTTSFCQSQTGTSTCDQVT